MPFVIEENGTPDVQNTEEYFLSCLFNVVDSPSSLTTRRLRSKLYVDDVEIPFKRATWSVQDSNPAGSLEVQLADLGDRDLFTRTAEIKLAVEEYLSAAWSVIKTYCDGSILATSSYILENQDDKPNDSFTISVLPVLQQRLNLTPEQLVILYDDNRVTIDEDSLETVPNIDGTTGTNTVTAMSGMTLADVLDWVANTLGFDGHRTNINESVWTLPRVDFPPAQPYWNTIAGIIGNHEPKLSISSDNYLVIRDGTSTDYISSRTMTLNNFRRVELNNTIERYKGCYLTYQLQERDWDTWVFDVQHTEEWFEGIVNQYPKVETETWLQKFYKLSFPNTPVDTRILKQYRYVYANATTPTAATGEVYSYLNGQMIRRDKREFGRVKAPQAWINYQSNIPAPIAGFSASFGGPEEAYTSASDATNTEAFVLTGTERETYTYRAHPFQPDSVYAAEHSRWVKGLIIVDSDNQQLGEDFEQSLKRSEESGNRVEGQGSRYNTTDFQSESQQILKNRKVLIRQRGSTPLQSSGLNYQDIEDVRVGDVDVQLIKPVTKSIYITEGGDATATLWRSIHGGEAPLIVLQPLCNRLNTKQDYPGGIQAPLPTYDETMEIGKVIDPQVDGRTATSLGTFEVIGYTDTISSLEDGGIKTEVTAKQIDVP